MTISISTRTYIGKGKIGLRNRILGGGIRYVGNTSKLTTAISTDKKTLANNETAGGGNAAVLERVKDFTGSLDCHDFSAENLALAVRGNITTEASASVSAEAHTAYTNCLVLFDHLPDMSATVTPVIVVTGTWAATTAYALGAKVIKTSTVHQVTTAGTSGGTEPTWAGTLGGTVTDGTVVWTNRGALTMVDGTDYQEGKSGIEILSTATRFALGLPITVAYTQNAANFVQLLTESADEYELVLDGLNEVDSGNPFPMRLFRVKFSPTSGLDFKGDDFGVLSLSFEALPDTTVTGSGLSQYGKIGLPV